MEKSEQIIIFFLIWIFRNEKYKSSLLKIMDDDCECNNIISCKKRWKMQEESGVTHLGVLKASQSWVLGMAGAGVDPHHAAMETMIPPSVRSTASPQCRYYTPTVPLNAAVNCWGSDNKNWTPCLPPSRARLWSAAPLSIDIAGPASLLWSRVELSRAANSQYRQYLILSVTRSAPDCQTQTNLKI